MDHVVCAICLEVLDKPVMCPNGHNFCLMCLRVSLRSKKECPACKVRLAETNAYPNRALEGLIEDMMSSNIIFTVPQGYNKIPSEELSTPEITTLYSSCCCNDKLAFMELKSLANNGNKIAKLYWMMFYHSHSSRIQNKSCKSMAQVLFDELSTWLRKEAALGNAEGLLGMGFAHYHGMLSDGKADLQMAIQCFKDAAIRGQPVAQHSLGLGYLQEKGPHFQYLSFLWLRHAAEQGLPAAQSDVGVAYHTGRGVPVDREEAVAWYKTAASKGYAPAQHNLGVCNREMGRDNEALSCFLKASQAEIPDAQYNAGVCYYYGRGALVDKSKALLHFENAAQHGHVQAQYMAGICHSEGVGDMHEATKWFELAARNGSGMARVKQVTILAKLVLTAS